TAPVRGHPILERPGDYGGRQTQRQNDGRNPRPNRASHGAHRVTLQSSEWAPLAAHELLQTIIIFGAKCVMQRIEACHRIVDSNGPSALDNVRSCASTGLAT